MERLKHLTDAAIGKTTGEILMRSFNSEPIDPDNNLEKVKNYLENGSIIIVHNHGKNDLYLWTPFVKEYVSDLRRVKTFVSQRYVDTSLGGFESKGFSTLISKWEAYYGVRVLPLVQKKDEETYPNHKRINFSSMLKAREFLQTPGHVLGFAPEGTRSPNGQMIEAVDDSDIILRLNPEGTLFLPVAAEFPTDKNLKPYLSRDKVKIHVGRLFSAANIADDKKRNPDIAKKDLIALRIAKLLPEQNQGFYARMAADLK